MERGRHLPRTGLGWKLGLKATYICAYLSLCIYNHFFSKSELFLQNPPGNMQRGEQMEMRGLILTHVPKGKAQA